MLFAAPVDFEEAMHLQAVKTILPMTLDSAQYRALAGEIKRRATFASRVTSAELLDQLAGLTQDALAGELDTATARLQLQHLAELLGQPLASSRADLMLSTNLLTAQGYGMLVRQNEPDRVQSFPAWELYRVEDRQEPRDWRTRWQVSAGASGDGNAARVFQDTGRMVALKDSQIWSALGDSGLWDDALDNPYPPFYFRSGVYGIREVDHADCVALGLLAPGQTPAPAPVPAFNETLQTSYEFRSAAIRDALQATGLFTFEDGVLKPKP